MKKNKVAIFCLILLFLTLPLLTFAQDYYYDYGSSSSSSSSSGWNIGNISGFGLPDQPIWNIVRNLVLWTLYIFGFLGILGFVISGIMYLISFGDDDMIKKAKKAMYYSIIGVIVGLVGFILIQSIQSALEGGSYI